MRAWAYVHAPVPQKPAARASAAPVRIRALLMAYRRGEEAGQAVRCLAALSGQGEGAGKPGGLAAARGQ
ncbi:hypothetical protein SHKM778_75770 [Streptomyces sp. KM77-8]|uniref:Uncharacterized protein n=1 Tax=Streptomyces haneummycinicus TaxID=3074435 RepID=A0AAT9HVN0_9ACTN